MNKEYNLFVERSVKIPYSISGYDALELIGEEWNEKIKEKCKSNEVILDLYMTKFAQKVKEGNHDVDLDDYFIAHDEEYTSNRDQASVELEAIATNQNGYRESKYWTYDTDTQEVVLEGENGE